MKEPHFLCQRCAESRYQLGGCSAAVQHTRDKHPGKSMDARFIMLPVNGAPC